jgi:hypothetical protein
MSMLNLKDVTPTMMMSYKVINMHSVSVCRASQCPAGFGSALIIFVRLVVYSVTIMLCSCGSPSSGWVMSARHGTPMADRGERRGCGVWNPACIVSFLLRVWGLRACVHSNECACVASVSDVLCNSQKKNSVYVFHSLTHSSEAAKSMNLCICIICACMFNY